MSDTSKKASSDARTVLKFEGASATGANVSATSAKGASAPELEPVFFSADVLTDKTFAKLGMQRPPAASSQPRRLPRKTVFALVAAAILLFGVPSAYAVGNLLATMGSGDLGFFASQGDPNGTGTSELTDGSTPTYFVSMQSSLEQANAPVGQTLTFGGGSITLDALAIDDNFINTFFTIRYDEPIDRDALHTGSWSDGRRLPDWDDLQALTPIIESRVDGQEITPTSNISSGGGFVSDAYFADERTIVVMYHQPLSVTLPDTFDLTISLPYGAMYTGVDESLAKASAVVSGSFAVSVDKSAVSGWGQSVEPGTYTFSTDAGDLDLILNKLALSPFGGVAIVDSASPVDLTGFVITDDKGNTGTWYLRGNGQAWSLTGPEVTPGELTSPGLRMPNGTNMTYELLGLDPEASSITITPVMTLPYVPFSDSIELRTVDPRVVGTRIPSSAIGGCTVSSYTVADGTVTIRLKPYGYVGDILSFELMDMMDDELLDKVLTSDRRVGILTSYYDYATGELVISTTYYAATDAELEQISSYHYIYDTNLQLDTSAAITLPLR